MLLIQFSSCQRCSKKLFHIQHKINRVHDWMILLYLIVSYWLYRSMPCVYEIAFIKCVSFYSCSFFLWTFDKFFVPKSFHSIILSHTHSHTIFFLNKNWKSAKHPNFVVMITSMKNIEINQNNVCECGNSCTFTFSSPSSSSAFVDKMSANNKEHEHKTTAWAKNLIYCANRIV